MVGIIKGKCIYRNDLKGNKNYYFDLVGSSSYWGCDYSNYMKEIQGKSILVQVSDDSSYRYLKLSGVDCNFSFVSFLLVVRLVKSKDNIKRLRLKMESKTAKDFEFDDGKVR